ncbi:MAG: VWA domain-containing protein [Kiritimatiellia bacterium]|jgi:Mg-chelatase subunit ChlD|nr:VWA domain-containing protein [Kiritimatiellia bacterium]
MTPYGFRPHPQTHDRHVLLACAAVLLSAVIHVVLMVFFSDWAISGISSLRERGREWFAGDRVPPMRVETMRADPMHIGRKKPGERDTPSRGPIEVSERVEALSQSAAPVLTAPPPIPREALQPGVPALKESASSQIDATPWMPRQEIAQIYDRTVLDEVAALPRREIPMIERVPDAPDIVPSIDLAGRRFGNDPEPPKPFEAAEVFDTEISAGTFKVPAPEAPATPAPVSTAATESRFAMQPGEKGGKSLTAGSAAGGPDGTRAAELQKRIERELAAASQQISAAEVSEEERRAREAQARVAALQEQADYQPIDDLLAVGLETYRDPSDPGRVYFRIGIEPRRDRTVPTLAKDIVWVQDVSASMSEERMVFCRRAMAAALETMNPGDRFNVAAFRDTTETCFPDWVPVTEAHLKTASAFVAAMRAFGQTDVFGSLRTLMSLPRDPKRPMIAFIVTDGKPTFGVTESARIIGDFSKLNQGLVSINMYGTQSKANVYLLDMLTYGNRGGSVVLTGNRWDIPDSMAGAYTGIRHPVMSDIQVTFDSVSQSEVYPKRTTPLYKERQIQLHGVCPDTTEELVFQIRGLAADKGYDSIFRLSLSRHAKLGTAAVRQRWAYQKLYHLVSVYAVDPRQQVLAEMLKVNRQYGIPIPYESEMR